MQFYASLPRGHQSTADAQICQEIKRRGEEKNIPSSPFRDKKRVGKIRFLGEDTEGTLCRRERERGKKKHHKTLEEKKDKLKISFAFNTFEYRLP